MIVIGEKVFFLRPLDACGTKFGRLFGKLWVRDAGRAGRWITEIWYNSVFLQQDTLENLALEEIDQSNAVLFIHYDADTKMIYLYGKVRLLHNRSHSHSHPVRLNSSWIIKFDVWVKAEKSQRTLHHSITASRLPTS